MLKIIIQRVRLPRDMLFVFWCVVLNYLKYWSVVVSYRLFSTIGKEQKKRGKINCLTFPVLLNINRSRYPTLNIFLQHKICFVCLATPDLNFVHTSGFPEGSFSYTQPYLSGFFVTFFRRKKSFVFPAKSDPAVEINLVIWKYSTDHSLQNISSKSTAQLFNDVIHIEFVRCKVEITDKNQVFE
jgi:hypothetical protein